MMSSTLQKIGTALARSIRNIQDMEINREGNMDTELAAVQKKCRYWKGLCWGMIIGQMIIGTLHYLIFLNLTCQ